VKISGWINYPVPSGTVRAVKCMALALLTGIPVAVAFANVYTVVTGVGDTMHYFAAARDILNASSREDWFHALFRWAPGWPLTIAMFMRQGGTAYIYFLVPVLAWATLFASGIAVWRLTRRFATGMTAALAIGYFLMFRTPLVTYFLLYPFREPLSFLGLSLGWVAVISGCRTQGWRRYVLLSLSGLTAVLAAGVREPAIFSLAGLAAYALLAKENGSVRTRIASVIVVLSPLLLAVLALGGLFLLTGRIGSAQFSGWRSMTAARTLGEWQGMCVAYVRLSRNLLGISGLGLLGAGVVVAGWKHRAAVVMLLIPALATLAFYATFAVYPRYALSIAIFLVPLAGGGGAFATDTLYRVLRRRAPALSYPVYPVVWLLLVVLSCHQAAALSPWGRTTLRELRQRESLLKRYISAGDSVVIDFRYRHLHDFLLSYLGITPAGAVPSASAGAGPRRIFIEPRSDEGRVRANVQSPVVNMGEEILQRQDLVPVCDAEGHPVEFTLAGAPYALREIRPWSRQQTRETVFRGDVIGGLIWFDFRESDAGTGRRIAWQSPGGDPLQEGMLPPGRGLVACAAGTLFEGRDAVLVSIESDTLLPAEVVVRADAGIQQSGFGFGNGRRPSVMSWVEDPVYRSTSKWGAVFGSGAAFRIPNPVGADDRVLAITFEYQIRFPVPATGLFRYRDAAGPLAEVESALQGEGILQTVRVPPMRRTGSFLSVAMDAELPSPFENHFRLVAIRLQLE